jgi:senataxin
VRGTEARPPAAGGCGGSWANAAEAALALALARAFLAAAPSLAARHDGIAVVSPYRGQVAAIRALFEAELGPELARRIDVNTIDGFQGREREVVLFSVVRSPKGSQEADDDGAPPAQPPRIGFVADERRMNVGLTRARAALVVIGNAAALRGDVHWGSLVEDARARGRIVRAMEPAARGGRSYEEQIAALGALAPGAPLQAPREDAAEEEEWAPQAEAHVDPGAMAAEEFSGGEEEWAYGDGRDGDDDGAAAEEGKEETPEDGAAAAAAAARAAKRAGAGGGRGRAAAAPAPKRARAGR